MQKIKPRPRDFFGPEDWPWYSELDVVHAQQDWDYMYRSLPLWRRIVYQVMGR